MLDKLNYIAILGLSVALLVVGGVAYNISDSPADVDRSGGLIEPENPIFSNGLRGPGQVQVVDSNGDVVGSINTSKKATTTGGLDVQSGLNVSGESQLDGLVWGGNASTTLNASSTQTLTAAQVCNNTIVNQPDWDGVSSSTAELTLPTLANLKSDCLDDNGDTKWLVVRNQASAAASTTQIVANASTTLLEPDGQNVLIGGGSSALVRVLRVSANELFAVVDEVIDAD